MSSSRRTTSDQEKPTVFVQPSRTEKVSRDVSPTVSPFSARRRHANEPILPNVPLDASLIELNAGLYEDLGLLLHKDDAWRKLLQTEEKVTRKMEMDACSYMEGFKHKQGKKALDILSDKGWTIQRMRESFHQLGLMDCLDLLERVLGAEEIAHINNGISMENLNAGPISASSLSINSQQSVDSEGLGTETDSVSSDQMFGGGNGERIEARSARTDTETAVQQVRPVSEPFDVANDPGPEEEASGEALGEKMEQEAEDRGLDQAVPIQHGIHQDSGAGRCKLLLPNSSIPVTQAIFLKPPGSDDACLTESFLPD